jgi:uncharacterized protein YyaL (SSP411 family)
MRPTLALLLVCAVAAGGARTAAADGPAAGRHLTAQQQQFLQTAEQGVAKAKALWWDAQLGWYDEYRYEQLNEKLLMLWSGYELFNAVNGIALADPTPANVRAVRAFANGAETYWNPRVKPVGAYAYYPHYTVTSIRYYFDDNGWWAIAFLDSYRVTHDRRYLNDSLRAFRFLATAGWDARSGGFWWDTYHEHKTSEPLAAAILTGARLWKVTHDRAYLRDAIRWLAWADAHSWNSARGLYQRSANDPTVMSYVEGLMAAANEELCHITGGQHYCRRAEQVARDSVTAFGANLDWNPRYDAVDLYGILNLYALDHNPQWYSLALANAQRALATQDANGLFLTGWNHEQYKDDTEKQALGLDAASLSVFAWLAAVPAPG